MNRSVSALRRSLLSNGLVAIALIAALSAVLWAFVLRTLAEPSRSAVQACSTCAAE